MLSSHKLVSGVLDGCQMHSAGDRERLGDTQAVLTQRWLEFNSSLTGEGVNGKAGTCHKTPLLLFTDLIPSDQRLPLPPQWGEGQTYIIYIGNGQGSVGTISLCLVREN